MSEAEAPPILDAVFHALRARDVPIDIRDYCDAIRALRLGFGVGSRHRLRVLCQTLWARSDDERRIVDMVFEEIPPPTAEEMAAVAPLLRSAGGDQTESAPDRAETLPAGNHVLAPTPEATLEPRAGIEFASRRAERDLPLPRLDLGPLSRSETFILDPQTPVPERTLAILWRRLRSPSRTRRRSGREIDLRATVAERCHRGILSAVVCRPERENTARLLVLADVSPSMAPWLPLVTALSRSLAYGRLKSAELWLFSNWPRVSLFRTPNLTEPAPIDTVLRDNAGAALLIVSDAGAARGSFDRRRFESADAFLRHDCRQHDLRPIVWINPVPRPFWEKSTAEALHRRGHAVFLPLDDPSLIRAIDVLRGAKAA